MPEYKSIIMVVPYIGEVINGSTFLLSLDSSEIEFIGRDLIDSLKSEETHASYTECISSIKNKLSFLNGDSNATKTKKSNSDCKRGNCTVEGAETLHCQQLCENDCGGGCQ